MQTNSPPVSPIRHIFANPISVTNSEPNEMNIFSNSHNISPSSSIPTGDPFLVDTINEETIIGGILHLAEHHVDDQTSDYSQSQRRPQIIPKQDGKCTASTIFEPITVPKTAPAVPHHRMNVLL